MEAQGSVQLQDIVDAIAQHDELLKLNLSVTVADPLQQDCPLVACSDGFTELTGYHVSEIVGRNCRFLLNGVPDEYIDEETRLKCRHYVATTKGAAEDPTPDMTMTEYLKTRPWMTTRPGEIICVQTNATKSGELFKNMFYMKQVELNERSFILGLQAKLPETWETTVEQVKLEAFCEQAFASLGKNMRAVEEVLSRHFWYSAAARRQDCLKTVLPSFVLQAGVGLAAVMRRPMAVKGFPFAKEEDLDDEDSHKWHERQVSAASTGMDSTIDEIDADASSFARHSTPGSVGSAPKAPRHVSAPASLSTCFDASGIQPWPAARFETLGKIEDANRNQGSVCLMKDTAQGILVAVKQMPNSWVGASHDEFQESHPDETEQPWNDIGCNRFLNSIGFPYCMPLLGVFRDQDATRVVTEFANSGDLFSWASELKEEPGPAREALVKPLVKQVAHSIQCLHDLSIAHGDVSIENILLHARGDQGPQIRLIDFGAASAKRFLAGHVTGKPSYQAPEIFEEGVSRDAFLSDTFSLGVVIYAACLMDYPWISTEGKGDKCFQYMKSKGFAEYARKRKLPNSRSSVEEVVSPELLELLGGLLEVDPSKRLTLGEQAYNGSSRKSIWDMAWMQ